MSHPRLGHVSENGMSTLAKQGYLGDAKITALDFYEACVYGKVCKAKFRKWVHRFDVVLDYVHSDPWG